MGKANDTPLMRQYLEIKNRYPDALLFFRMGDFYEMFFDDAVVAADALEVTLTSRDKNKEDPIPMCGVPHHAVTGYIRKALDRGFKVAICDQIEDPRAARGLVKRAVTRVITPGVVLDADHLEAKTNNYMMALTADADGGPIGLAALDLSTFELLATQVTSEDAVLDELARLRPKEVIWDERRGRRLKPIQEAAGGVWQVGGSELFAEPGAASVEQDEALVHDKSGGAELGDLGSQPQALAAAAAALRYAEATQPATGVPICRILAYRPADHLQLDEATIINLEIFESMMERRRKGSLLWVLDATLTAMGGRMLRKILGQPLIDLAAIRRRHDAVELLVDQATLRRRVREALTRVYDLERLTSRVVLQAATPRELARMRRSLDQLPAIAELLREASAKNLAREVPDDLVPPRDLLADVTRLLEDALVDDPPVGVKDGGVFRQGYSPELDEIVRLSDGGKTEILKIEERERQRTGISSLKVRYNKVFGYFIEVTKANLKSVPSEYQRKQTLVNAERFVTPELAEHEAKVLGAEERRVALEQELFERLRGDLARQAGRLTAAARWVATLDVLCSLAEVAQRHDYVRPEVDEGTAIAIEEGRHPVVERFMPAGQFVPNDVALDPDHRQLLVITGPNMAGKSTVMRQVALITLMAQVGSFVPARRAQIGIVDRIFTRVGASDNLARGESTFMVEMRETASILRNASSRSLIVLDEIGRGTATYDGISIAWAVAEHLHDRIRAKALFATHYHELCALADVKPRVKNFNIAVQEWRGKVVFLRKLVPGGSSRSYGIEVARLAGLDNAVVARSRKILAALEQGEVLGGVPIRGQIDGEGDAQLSLFRPPAGGEPTSAEERSVIDELRALDPERITPIEALTCIASLVEKLSDSTKKS